MDNIESVNNPLIELPLKQLQRIAKRPPIDIEFQNLIYSVRDRHLKGGWRQLLKSINGRFLSGELSVIMGPSGAGKSTLLNILAGYVSAGVRGSIKINDRPRVMKTFNKLSSYIMQEDNVQPRLTVQEAMSVAASLKLSPAITKEQKLEVVDEVLELLGLVNCKETMSEYLSGGQRKRLAIALELVNNPPVIFLDEPTSGLDNYAIKQCMDLLQKITKLGRTVICTIHQPPASLFQNFDQVYILSNGYCVYNGSPKEVVPFLSGSEMPCPPNHTPADYIIELVHSNPDTVNILSANIQNGKMNLNQKSHSKHRNLYDEEGIYNETTQELGSALEDIDFPTSSWMQFTILISRMFTQMKRNRTMLYIQFFHHLLSSFINGVLFYGMGNDASQTISIFKYCVCINVFFMYTHVMAPVLLFPLEVKLLRREYFNRWYSLKSYYMALTLINLPLILILGMMYLVIIYFISDQPAEANRFMWFCIVGLVLAVCSQGLGYAIGAMFSITNGSIVGPSVLAPLLALAVYGMGYQSDIVPFMKVLMSMSFLRFGVVALTGALFSDRDPLRCDEIYCHYKNPSLLMRDMGMADQSYKLQLVVLIAYLILFRVMAYLALKYRLTRDFSNKFVQIAAKIIRQKDSI